MSVIKSEVLVNSDVWGKNTKNIIFVVLYYICATDILPQMRFKQK